MEMSIGWEDVARQLILENEELRRQLAYARLRKRYTIAALISKLEMWFINADLMMLTKLMLVISLVSSLAVMVARIIMTVLRR